MIAWPDQQAGRAGPVVPCANEPQATIYQRIWRRARIRLTRSTVPERVIQAALLDHIERGWQHLRRLQLAYEGRAALPPGKPTEDLLDFIDSDLVDAFRTLSCDAALLVMGADSPECRRDGVPGVDDLTGAATMFSRYLALLNLAVRDSSVPDDIRSVVQEVTTALVGWPEDLDDLIATLEPYAGD
jgi:hypothetical protein